MYCTYRRIFSEAKYIISLSAKKGFHVNKGFQESSFWRENSFFHLIFVDASFLQNPEALFSNVRSSRLEMLFEIDVLKNFAIFTEKHLCWSLFLIKLQV